MSIILCKQTRFFPNLTNLARMVFLSTCLLSLLLLQINASSTDNSTTTTTTPLPVGEKPSPESSTNLTQSETFLKPTYQVEDDQEESRKVLGNHQNFNPHLDLRLPLAAISKFFHDGDPSFVLTFVGLNKKQHPLLHGSLWNSNPSPSASSSSKGAVTNGGGQPALISTVSQHSAIPSPNGNVYNSRFNAVRANPSGQNVYGSSGLSSLRDHHFRQHSSVVG